MLYSDYSTFFTPDHGRERLIGGLEGLTLTDGPTPRVSFPQFFGDQKEGTGRGPATVDRPMFSWSLNGDDDFHRGFQLNSEWRLEEDFGAGLTLDELADDHLQNHASGRKGTSADGGGGGGVEPVDASRDNGRCEKLQEELGTSAEEEELLFMKRPSSLGRVLCGKQHPRKNAACTEIQRVCLCPPEIKPFDFKTPSPDDIVRESQKAQKRGIRK